MLLATRMLFVRSSISRKTLSHFSTNSPKIQEKFPKSVQDLLVEHVNLQLHFGLFSLGGSKTRTSSVKDFQDLCSSLDGGSDDKKLALNLNSLLKKARKHEEKVQTFKEIG